MVPNELKYTEDHEWIRVEGNTGTIGVTDYAQGELGDVVFVDIPEDLEELTKGDSFGTIEAVKTVSDLFAPCDGKVIEVNTALADDPQKVNSDPYGEGWLVKVELSDPSQLDSLLDAESYKSQIGE
ncbi:MAG: glycine cleavage system protein GcvH [Melioribacteraceae bacterium]|nr:glycine cleavage system protein GcvH [Melioribacteraceae bacterium]